MGLEDFHIKDGVLTVPGTRRLDHGRIAALPDDEFLSVHNQLMEEYRHNGWWTPGNIPSCRGCDQPIDSPRNLVRYFGISYDPRCFRETWAHDREEETKRNPDFGRYLDRLVELLGNDHR